MSKKRGFLPKEQEMRDDLARDLKILRKSGDTGKELAKTLLEKERDSDRYIAALTNSGRMDYDSSKEVERLIKKGRGYIVAQRLDEFEGLDKDVAKKLIELGEGKAVAKNMDSFEGLDKDVAKKLIELGEGKAVAKNMDSFEGFDKEVAEMLITRGERKRIVKNIDKFEGLDKDICRELFDKCCSAHIMDPEKFNKLFGYIIENLDKIKGLSADRVLMNEFLEGMTFFPWDTDFLLKNIDKFDEIQKMKIAEELVKSGRCEIVVKYLYSFGGLNEKILKILMEYGYRGIIGDNLNKFTGLNNDIAKRILEGDGERGPRYVGENIDRFEGINFQEIANLYRDTEMLARYLGQFKELNESIAKRLIDRGFVRVVAANLNVFKLDCRNTIIKMLIKAEKLSKFGFHKFNLSEFDLGIGGDTGVDIPGYISARIGQLEGLDKEVAEYLIKKGKISVIAKNLDKFKGLDGAIEKKLLEAGFGDAVEGNKEKFSSNENE